jgi:hypothetical protein
MTPEGVTVEGFRHYTGVVHRRGGDNCGIIALPLTRATRAKFQRGHVNPVADTAQHTSRCRFKTRSRYHISVKDRSDASRQDEKKAADRTTPGSASRVDFVIPLL